jgi:hypothetical protein
MTATDKRPLIYESVVVTQIDIHPKGEEPDQHLVRAAPRVSCTTTIRKVPTRSKSGPCFRDEVLAPSDARLTVILGYLILPPTNHLEAKRCSSTK